ncbi:hypothetical protein BV22DRAFT_1031008 [Leucogyrophana mollusca]|uniref:Uncharacterized protein n=1 Tax=Leucogyrophana mollusca TaxID=85980 RepID=A0ACB8BSE4_9AGAM|nr:hypothetical protein BV22DRAFT_1031008 [Leucogyrophana mollusca]
MRAIEDLRKWAERATELLDQEACRRQSKASPIIHMPVPRWAVWRRLSHPPELSPARHTGAHAYSGKAIPPSIVDEHGQLPGTNKRRFVDGDEFTDSRSARANKQPRVQPPPDTSDGNSFRVYGVRNIYTTDVVEAVQLKRTQADPPLVILRSSDVVGATNSISPGNSGYMHVATSGTVWQAILDRGLDEWTRPLRSLPGAGIPRAPLHAEYLPNLGHNGQALPIFPCFIKKRLTTPAQYMYAKYAVHLFLEVAGCGLEREPTMVEYLGAYYLMFDRTRPFPDEEWGDVPEETRALVRSWIGGILKGPPEELTAIAFVHMQFIRVDTDLLRELDYEGYLMQWKQCMPYQQLASVSTDTVRSAEGG